MDHCWYLFVKLLPFWHAFAHSCSIFINLCAWNCAIDVTRVVTNLQVNNIQTNYKQTDKQLNNIHKN